MSDMRDPIIFMKIGNVLVNVAHIVSVEYHRGEEVGDMVFNEQCNIRTVDGRTYLYFGSQKEFLDELTALMEKAR